MFQAEGATEAKQGGMRCWVHHGMEVRLKVGEREGCVKYVILFMSYICV